MYCHHCGARISDMASSCPRCGRDVVRWAIRERLDQLERRINWLAEALQRMGREVAPWLREGKPEVPAERVEPVAPPVREKRTERPARLYAAARQAPVQGASAAARARGGVHLDLGAGGRDAEDAEFEKF